MRAAPLLHLLVPAALGAGLGLSLVSCHKERLPQAKATAPAAERRLKLEAYDPVIPKAPLPAQKLDTTAEHPQLAQAAPAPSAQEGPSPPAPRPQPRPRAEDYARQTPMLRPRQPARVYAYAEPGEGRYIESRQAGQYAPDDPRAEAPPDPSGFRLTVPMCRRAAQQGDPLAETPECLGMLQAARIQAELCARAYEEGDDRVVRSPACRQAAMAR